MSWAQLQCNSSYDKLSESRTFGYRWWDGLIAERSLQNEIFEWGFKCFIGQEIICMTLAFIFTDVALMKWWFFELTWLVLGENPAARFPRVDQFTAFWGLQCHRCLSRGGLPASDCRHCNGSVNHDHVAMAFRQCSAGKLSHHLALAQSWFNCISLLPKVYHIKNFELSNLNMKHIFKVTNPFNDTLKWSQLCKISLFTEKAHRLVIFSLTNNKCIFFWKNQENLNETQIIWIFLNWHQICNLICILPRMNVD